MTEATVGNFEELVSKIRNLEVKSEVVIVAISGFCGSGKSTLTKKLQKELGDAAHVPGDAFMTDRLERLTDDWSTIDRARIISQVLKPARAGLKIDYQVYDWDQNKAEEWQSVPLPKYLLLEGIGTVHPDTIGFFDYIVWVERDQKVAAAQGNERDRLRGHDHHELWDTFLIPNDLSYFRNRKPRNEANFVYVS